MLKDYEYVVKIFEGINERAGKRVSSFFKKFPEGIKQAFSTSRKCVEILEGERESWTYVSEQGVKLVTMMNDINQISAGDQEITFLEKDQNIRNMQVGETKTIAMFSEVIFIALNRFTGERVGEFEHEELAIYKTDENKYKAILMETNGLYEHKLVATQDFVIEERQKEYIPVENDIQK